MKQCIAYQEMVSAYIDGELEEAKTAPLFLHLGECMECRSVMKLMLRLRAELMGTNGQRSSRSVSQSYWNRRLSVSYPLAASFACFVVLSALYVAFMMFTVQPESERTRVEFISSTPLPAVYVIDEPVQSIIYQ